MNTEQTDVGTLLDTPRRDMNDTRLELLEQLLSAMRREVQQALTWVHQTIPVMLARLIRHRLQPLYPRGPALATRIPIRKRTRKGIQGPSVPSSAEPY